METYEMPKSLSLSYVYVNVCSPEVARRALNSQVCTFNKCTFCHARYALIIIKIVMIMNFQCMIF